MLQKVNAPECPKCGCNATHLAGAGERAGRAWARFACDFCSAQFFLGSPPSTNGVTNGVVEQPVRCPACKSRKVPVNNTKRVGNTILRHRKCGNCSHTFNSTLPVEQD